MSDPIDWGAVLESPVFWGAVMALLGVLAGHWQARSSSHEENELAGLKASVEVLRAEYSRLNDEVKELRLQMEGERKRYRKLSEKYSAAIAYIQILWVRLGEYPPAPDLIAEDMTPLPE
ncbi:hypothetical protein FYJ24_06800 [Actinomycetaceae bacterium WB03_NA08]|uniref:Uncharacterized protein n=1 Tax=Scrofimicrobium canadense TaxID=2652290 RepID=A0A6N7W585_9ACTO|nr:hypothetical protein [Scrofimicrobium canadense]MSS84475.1 hypothetical protein [Scrofimicrobium canadense]